VTLGLGNISAHNYISIAIPLIVGCASLVLFAVRQLRMEAPFLDVRLLKNRELRLSIIGITAVSAVLLATSLIFVRKQREPVLEKKFAN